MRTIVWYRGKDLRVADHAPLRDAAAGGEVIPLFVLEPQYFAGHRTDAPAHRLQYLLQSLCSLRDNLRRLGSDLVVVHGPAGRVVPELRERLAAQRVLAHQNVEPGGRRRDERVAQALGRALTLYPGETLLPPGTLRTKAGTPFAVYSQFARAFERQEDIGPPLPAPRRLPPLPAAAMDCGIDLPSLADLGIRENPQLVAGGERAARKRLADFIEAPIAEYAGQRDRMDLAGTSRLSADLKFGTLSIRTVWHAVEQATASGKGPRTFRNELLWREFSYSTLWDRPALLHAPFRADFEGFPWTDDGPGWEAWVQGRTGYPVVDAAARQLLAEGFVHNRARMISASFLTKHLLIHYGRGEAHYMRYLTDGDPAQNNAGWQWSAGCGCDAQPYFRIFNPILQGERFDPEGDYVRRWVPELQALPTKFIHRPWDAPLLVLQEAGVKLGDNYPQPIIEHRLGRERFLALAQTHVKRGGNDAQTVAG